MLNVKHYPRGGFDKATVLTHAACASNDELSIGLGATHRPAADLLGVYPDGHGDGCRGRTSRIALRKLRQGSGVGNHETFGVGNQLN